MTPNTIKKQILAKCKYCKNYLDLGKKQTQLKRHRCYKNNSTIYEAYNCERIDPLAHLLAALEKKI